MVTKSNMNIDLPNIIFIVSDALRAKSMSCYGFHRKTTPFLEKLSNEGVLFNNAYAAINATDPSLTTMFSGYYPVSHGIINHGTKVKKTELTFFYATKIKLLPEILLNLGYKTFAIDWLGRWHKRGYTYYFKHGLYDKERTKIEDTLSKIINMVPLPQQLRRLIKIMYSTFISPSIAETGEYLTTIALDILEKNIENPIFLFIHYWDTHNIYNPGKVNYKLFIEKCDFCDMTLSELIQKHLRNMSNKYKDFLLNAYDSKTIGEIIALYYASIKNVDSQLKRIYDFIRKNQMEKNTLLVFTGDHGESLIEHNIYFEHNGLYEETMRVPLLMIYKSVLPRGQRMNIDVHHVDLVPTILNLLNIKYNDTRNMDGENILPYIQGEKEQGTRILLFEEHEHQEKIGLKIGRYKYIESLSGTTFTCRRCGLIHGGPRELYDLREDPAEIKDLSNIRKQLTNELHNTLKKIRTIKMRRMGRRILKNKIKRIGG